MELNTIPRTLVKNYLDGLRFPLSTIERLSGQAQNEAWPPALAFEEFQASAKQFAGSVLRDSVLVDEGRLQAVKVSELRRALELDAKAQAKRAQADAKLQQEQAAADRERERAETQAREREQQIERQRRESEQRVADAAAEAADSVAQAEAARAEQVAATERRAKLASANAETVALEKQRSAVASAERVATLANAVETKKKQRKNS